METIYYHLDAREVSARDMASGETAPRCRSYAVLRRVEEKRAVLGDKVLDMEAYRRKLEGASVAGGVPDASSLDEEERYAAVVPAPRRARRSVPALDFLATVAVLVMAAVVVTSFLPFL